MSRCNHPEHNVCPDNGTDYHGRCLGACGECGEHMLSTGRYTTFCPSCNVCPDCQCPQADGFAHNQGCESAPAEEE